MWTQIRIMSFDDVTAAAGRKKIRKANTDPESSDGNSAA